MAEHVVHVEPSGNIRGRAGLGRLAGLLERTGDRSRNARDIAAVTALMVAARDRYPIARVRHHVCRHDEGVKDCTALVVED